MVTELVRLPDGNVGGIQYDGGNANDVIRLYFPAHTTVAISVTDMSIQHKSERIYVGDWIVRDEGVVRIVPAKLFQKMYRLKHAPTGYKMIDSATGKEIL